MSPEREFLLYADECFVMAECALGEADQARWRDLARMWLERAADAASAEMEPRNGLGSP